MELGINYATLRLYRTCNYSCSYCYVEEELRRMPFGRIATEDGMKRVKLFFDSRGEWHIHLTGGEPTLHPNFVELYKMLSENHYVNMVTNTSIKEDVLNRFISEINPERVDYIQCSLQERDQEGENFNVFFAKIKRLSENGFKPFVTYVPAPDRLDLCEKHYNAFSEICVSFVIQIYTGMLEGKKYPEAFTESEKDYMNKYNSSPLHRAVNKYGFWESIGKKCAAGHKRIIADCMTGDVYRCLRDKESIGRVYENRLDLSADYRTCVFEKCVCVYEMPLCVEGLLYKDMALYTRGGENAPKASEEIIKEYRENLVEAENKPYYMGIITDRKLKRLCEARKNKLTTLFNGCAGKKVGIYGAGTHTKHVMQDYKRFFGEPDFELFYFDSDKNREGEEFLNGKIYHISDVDKLGIDRLIISSITYQEEMYGATEALGLKAEIVKIYEKDADALSFANELEA